MAGMGFEQQQSSRGFESQSCPYYEFFFNYSLTIISTRIIWLFNSVEYRAEKRALKLKEREAHQELALAAEREREARLEAIREQVSNAFTELIWLLNLICFISFNSCFVRLFGQI